MLSREVLQGQMVDMLGKLRPTTAQLEARDDATVSNLHDYVQAMGGRLDLVATFPNAEPLIIDPLSRPGQNGRKR